MSIQFRPPARRQDQFRDAHKITTEARVVCVPLTPPEEQADALATREYADSALWTPPLDASELQAATASRDSAPASSPARGPARPVVAVLGVGYVGFHLVETFAQTHEVIAYDISESRLRDVAVQVHGLPVTCTSVPMDLAAATYFLIAVPTVLKTDKSVDLTYLHRAVETVAEHARPGSTIVVESSVAVGVTRQVLAPLAAAKGFHVGMSPERVDPGRQTPAFASVPKIVSALDDAALQSITALYERVFETVVPVSSPEVAEMTKLYENCQRMVCAAYANEMADACFALGLDPWEVSRAAATKPFGYAPFRPGPGVGGHCIPVNPYYLLSTSSMPLLQHATELASQRPVTLADRFMAELLANKKQTAVTTATRAARPRLLVVGMGFKRGQSVLSHSPGVAMVVRLLSEWETYVEFADPLVEQSALPWVPRMDPADWTAAGLARFDGILIAVPQPGLDLELLSGLPNHVVVHNYAPLDS